MNELKKQIVVFIVINIIFISVLIMLLSLHFESKQKTIQNEYINQIEILEEQIQRLNNDIEEIGRLNNNFSIALTEPPILYPGIFNFVSINIQGITLDSLYFNMTNGRVEHFNENLFKVFVTRGKKAKLTAYRKTKRNNSFKIFEKTFRVRSLPSPKTNFTNINEITKTQLLSIGGITSTIYNLHHEIPCEIKGFTINATINNIERNEVSVNEKFSHQQIEFINELKTNQHIVIRDIKALLPDNSIRILSPIVLIVI